MYIEGIYVHIVHTFIVILVVVGRRTGTQLEWDVHARHKLRARLERWQQSVVVCHHLLSTPSMLSSSAQNESDTHPHKQTRTRKHALFMRILIGIQPAKTNQATTFLPSSNGAHFSSSRTAYTRNNGATQLAAAARDISFQVCSNTKYVCAAVQRTAHDCCALHAVYMKLSVAKALGNGIGDVRWWWRLKSESNRTKNLTPSEWNTCREATRLNTNTNTAQTLARATHNITQHTRNVKHSSCEPRLRQFIMHTPNAGARARRSRPTRTTTTTTTWTNEVSVHEMAETP